MTVRPPASDELFPSRETDTVGLSRHEIAAELMSSPSHPDAWDDCLELVDADPEAAYSDVQSRWLDD